MNFTPRNGGISFRSSTNSPAYFPGSEASEVLAERQTPERKLSASLLHIIGSLTRDVVRPGGIAIALVAAALVATLMVRSLFPYPFLFLFFAAVMASAWLGGTGAGLFAVLLSTVAVAYFFVPPFNSFAINATDTTYFAAFVLCALVASWISASKKKSEEGLVEARDQLEFRVMERTAELRSSNAELRRSIQAHQKAEQALLETRAELAHLSRSFTMGELTSSIAHEVNQPLTAVVTYGHACVEWLSANPPNLGEARRSAERIIEDGTRAGDVLSRIRSSFRKDPPTRQWVNMNELIQELVLFVRGETTMHRISIRAELAPDLPRLMGDRVQLQQVVLNLLLNAIDAMRRSPNHPSEIAIRSGVHDSGGVQITVEDSGVGLSPEIADRIFQPFFTTKPQGIGMGLSISRSIVESHAGRLWAEPRPSRGAIFRFTIPIGS
jgi:C4-dicarboxylate-specific signal transduction histidine kinase